MRETKTDKATACFTFHVNTNTREPSDVMCELMGGDVYFIDGFDNIKKRHPSSPQRPDLVRTISCIRQEDLIEMDVY